MSKMQYQFYLLVLALVAGSPLRLVDTRHGDESYLLHAVLQLSLGKFTGLGGGGAGGA